MLKRSSDNRLNGGQVIVDYLVREKVPYVFGLCGHGNIGLLDALFERQKQVRAIRRSSAQKNTEKAMMAESG